MAESPDSGVEAHRRRRHLNRPIQSLIQSAGFAISQVRTGYMKGPKPLTFMYEGRATPE